MGRILVWSLVVLGGALVVAAQAAWALDLAAERCFFEYPVAPCPAIDDPAVAKLTFALLGLPLVWLLGLIVILARTTRRAEGRGDERG